MKPSPEYFSLLCILILLAGTGNAVLVKPSESIQHAIDSAEPGETIEVSSGVHHESLKITKNLVLRGIDTGEGMPAIESKDGPAITILSDGVILQGLQARASSGWGSDAGIVVLSDGNIIKNNKANRNGNAGIILVDCENNTLQGNHANENRNDGISLRNCSNCVVENNSANQNRYGIRLEASNGNKIISNEVKRNRFEGVYLQESIGNLLERNYAEGNWVGISLDASEKNILARNDLIGNDKGIYLANRSSTKDVQSQGKGVYISYSNEFDEYPPPPSYNEIFLNNLSNTNNAYDDGLNQWDNGNVGNNYSDFNDPDEGCTGMKICGKEHRITGGSSVDRYPLAAVVKPKFTDLRSMGPEESELIIDKLNFVPGDEMGVNFTTPKSHEAWISFGQGNTSWGDQYLGRNISGSLILLAPIKEGSYKLQMHDENRKEFLSLPFDVSKPLIYVSPEVVGTCEKIYVSYSGAPGLENDWIGMYRSNLSESVSRHLLKGKINGTIIFSAQETGNYEFKMFQDSKSLPLATSNDIDVETRSGVKVIALPSQVAPGGIITVTFWGAPPSGSGVIGMYGITSPDRFHIQKMPIGGRSCGDITFRAPSQPGQYDFRMFKDDVYRQILGQSNVVNVS